MSKKDASNKYNSGVSIIVLSRDGAGHLENLFSSFFDLNSHHPFEILLMDHASTDHTAQVIEHYRSRGYIFHLICDSNHSFAASNNYAARRAFYPNLLFLNNDILYTADALPLALEKLAYPSTGAVGIRLDDDPAALPPGKAPSVQHTGITFTWDENRGFYRPVQITHDTLEEAAEIKNGYYPAVTGAFLLCRRADFETVGGFHEEYDYGLEDIDFCLKLQTMLNKKSYCLNEISLLHVGGASRGLVDGNKKQRRRAHNETVFKRRMGETAAVLARDLPGNDRERPNFSALKKASRPVPGPGLRLLLVLPGGMEGNNGYQAAALVKALSPRGVEAIVAVPAGAASSHGSAVYPFKVRDYEDILNKGLYYSDGSGPDLVHAWTPREVVRSFVQALNLPASCPVVVHLEDNEEYLLETTLRRSFKELEQLPLKDLDSLVPPNRYHPQRGKKFLQEARGLTMIVETLQKFNYAQLPALTLLPPVDESLFYPRPLNYTLRRELGIPDDYIVLAYSGNVHRGNREEVAELYRAVQDLNRKGYRTVLLRTGLDVFPSAGKKGVQSRSNEKKLGWVDREKLPVVMASADFLVQPGTPGPFNDYRIPSKLPEYFALGRPVILPRTNLGLLAENGREARVLESADTGSIVASIIELKEDREKAELMAEGAAHFYLEKIAPLTRVEPLLDFYLQVSGDCLYPDGPDRLKEDSPGDIDDFLAPLLATARTDLRQALSAAAREIYAGVPWEMAEPGSAPVSPGPVSGSVPRAGGINIFTSLQAALAADRSALEPWIALVQNMPMHPPDHLRPLEPFSRLNKRAVFASAAWKNKGQNCRGLVAFSAQQAANLRAAAGVSVYHLSLPLPAVDRKWSPAAYRANASKKVIQVGWWMQRFHALHALPLAGGAKTWITGTENPLREIEEAESAKLKARGLLYDFMLPGVERVFDPAYDEYERLVCENVLFAHFYDYSCLRLVLECIARRAPLLVNPYAAYREYLGDGYPLYYYHYADAAEKAADHNLIEETHLYLQEIAPLLEEKDSLQALFQEEYAAGEVRK